MNQKTNLRKRKDTDTGKLLVFMSNYTNLLLNTSIYIFISKPNIPLNLKRKDTTTTESKK
jgi:hypothetical protein